MLWTGMLGYGGARFGRQGKARHGRDRSGTARHGRHGMVSCGKVSSGGARHGRRG